MLLLLGYDASFHVTKNDKTKKNNTMIFFTDPKGNQWRVGIFFADTQEAFQTLNEINNTYFRNPNNNDQSQSRHLLTANNHQNDSALLQIDPCPIIDKREHRKKLILS